MGTLPAYELKKLSDNDCLAVFAQHSLGTRDFSSHMSLEEISKKIVTKCDGLPLAAQALGGLLRGERDRGEWERVLSSKIWELQEEGCRIIPALAVSYYYLRPTLKQCFAYCSLLPKDYEFEEEEIILLWCASGFLDQKEREKTGEDLDMGNLAKLHHLKNSNTKSLEEMAVGIGRLTCLQTLCNFVVGKGPKGSGSGLRELKLLTHLHGTLNISKLENVKCVGTFPEHLPALEKLVIKGCEELSVSVSSLPALCKLQIGGCKEVVWRSATDNLGSQNSEVCRETSNQVFLAGPLKPRLPKLEELKINDMKEQTYIWKSHNELLQDICSLRRLAITSCPKLQSLVAEEEKDQQQQLCELSCRLEYLRLRYCEGLVKLPQSSLSLSSLREIEIYKCSSLVSFPEVALPSKLKKIEISGCDALKSLPEAWMCDTNSSLEILEIWVCHSLTYIAGVQLPPSLKQLRISDCDNIRTLTVEEGIQSSSSSRRYTSYLLEELRICSCRSLTCIFSKNELPATLESLEVGNLPPSLKSLHVQGCSKLESVAERLDNNTSLEYINISNCENLKILPSGLHNLRQLQEIEIWECENLVSFPVGGLPCAKLSKLRIYGCERLEALPKGLHNLTSLQQLKIGKGVELPSLEEDGLPTNLHSLDIRGNMEIWKSMIERGRGFHRFSSLRYLLISGCDDDMVSFPLEDKRLGTALPLPASLTTLRIEDFPNLERLSSSIVDLQNLTELILWGCPKLKYFPEKGLPSSLLKLWIYDCPLIEEKCRKDGGQYWDLLTHIPYVLINLACIMCW
ncbi:hypothetical protein CUMW_259730 [Citrus unshiu]|nr:hypothetical protein CUMW_259730 [Citrus unshiu]